MESRAKQVSIAQKADKTILADRGCENRKMAMVGELLLVVSVVQHHFELMYSAV